MDSETCQWTGEGDKRTKSEEIKATREEFQWVLELLMVSMYH